MEWSLSAARALAEGFDVFPLLASYERGLTPLKEAEPAGGKPGRLTTGLGDDLAMLVTKVAPTMSAEQADAWIKVVVLALSDLPGRVAREAAQAALHRPMRFPSDIEAAVRAEAGNIMNRHVIACSRLRELATEQHRPAPKADEFEPFEDAEIRRMSPELRRMGLACGALTQADIDRAVGDPPEQAAA